MEVKYKFPKGGRSLLAKVAAKSSSASGRGRGGGLTKGGGGYGLYGGGGSDVGGGATDYGDVAGGDGGTVMKGLSRPRAVGKGRGGARLESGEREGG